MPVYQYICDACHYEYNVLQQYTDDSLTVCPECGQPKLQKQYKVVGIIFKGDGFYQTDKNKVTS